MSKNDNSMIFIDSNIWMYAIGKEHPNKNPCIQFVERISQDPRASHHYCTSAEVLQEILHRYRALEHIEFAEQLIDAIVQLDVTIFPLRLEEILEAKKLAKDYTKLGARDLIHLATLRLHNIQRIVSYNRGFDQVSWVRRIEP